MGKNSAISWTDHTYNPWWGCQRVSPACEHCYAEAFAKRTGNKVWGAQSPRRFFGEKHWSEPVKWNRQAEVEGKLRRVFCASMADVFEDREDLLRERARLWELVEATPYLTWLLLTKRPENIGRMIPEAWKRHYRPNVWYGTTAEDQKWADKRIPALLRVLAAVHFVSVEPLLGALSLRKYLPGRCGCGARGNADCSCFILPGVDWVIVGGESGPGARMMELEWVRRLKKQCSDTGAAFWFKQKGAILSRKMGCKHPAGAKLSEWPDELKIQELPHDGRPPVPAGAGV